MQIAFVAIIGGMIIYGKRKIHITVTEDYITSYGNLSVNKI